LQDAAAMAEPTILYQTVHGSRAYGLARPSSDWDTKGVIVGPSAWYHGFLGGPEQLGEADHVLYEIRKFFRLAAEANPSLLEILYTDPQWHRVMTPAGERLLAARDQFLSRRVAGSFGGYALSQLKRIKTHRRWLLEPPQAAPTRVAFGLPEKAVAPPDQLGAYEAMRLQGEVPDADPNFLKLLEKERKYRAARNEWSRYQDWLAGRNPARAALEAQFGYDTKHAQHLVRLLRMGHEILATGQVIVTRPDRDELLAIRDGVLSYDALIEQADALYEAVEAAQATSPLPPAPDTHLLESLCVSLVEEALC
jgi:predicted nucleotidyltransferase